MSKRSNKNEVARRIEIRRQVHHARLRYIAILGLIVAVVSSAIGIYRHNRSNAVVRMAKGYADPATCATCHAKIAQEYGKTGMGRSFRSVKSHADDADFSTANSVRHEASGKTYRMIADGTRLWMRREVVDPGEMASAAYAQSIDYVIGSGNHAHTYLHRTPDNRLIELPVSWYSELGGYWAMSPGYDRASQMDFRRPIGKDCMFCHNGYPTTDPVASNTTDGAVFQAVLPEGIDCQRCHGPGAAHVQAAKSWRAKPEEVAASILNPADLSRERQLDVCRQCHLETTSLALPNAIRRYDRGAYSFRPGERLTDFQLYFDHKAGTGFEDRLEVAHQAYRLEKSKCFLKSQMTCTTCHDPHMARRGEDATRHYIQACEGCHQSEHPRLANQPIVNATSNCMDCHMWKRRTDDVVHVVMTDHYIQRFKPNRDLAGPIQEAIPEYHDQVEPYYPRLLADMPQGVLYNAVAQVAAGTNAEAGIPVLRSVLEQTKPKQAGFYFALASAYARLQKYAESIPWFEEALKQSDASSIDKRELAIALMHAGERERAVAMAQQAVAEQPTDLVARMNLANIYLQVGRVQDAHDSVDKVLAVDADLADANNILGLVLVREQKSQKSQEAQAAFRKALVTNPDLTEARVNLATSLAEQGDVEQAKRQMEAVAKENPLSSDIRRKYAMVLAGGKYYDEAINQIKLAFKLQPNSGYLVDIGDLLVAGGHVQEAVTYYRQAGRIDPGQVRAHLGLASILMAQNKTAAAETEYQLAAAASPRNGEAQLALAEIAMRRGDGVEVSRRLQLAAQSDDPAAREVANRSLRGNP